MRRITGIVLALALAGVARADDSFLSSMDTMDDARGWEAVGRIEIGATGFCTGTLIAPDLVLTAAHCLFEAETGARIPDAALTFRAGLRHGRALAERQVARSAVPDAYGPGDGSWSEGSANDLALLELDQPIRTPAIQPIAAADGLFSSTEVGIVSYALDRAEAPSLQEACTILGSGDGVYVLTCSVDFGSSGAPVFQVDAAGGIRIGAVVSAKAMLDEQRVAIGAPVAVLLPALVGQLRSVGAGPGGVRVLTPGQRSETGARFVRPGGS